MRLLVAYYVLSVLIIGAVGGWVLFRGPKSERTSLDLIQWSVVAFPGLLLLAVVLKPSGPGTWARLVQRPTSLDYLLMILVGLSVVRGIWEVVLVAVEWSRMRGKSVPAGLLVEATWLDYWGLCARYGLIRRPELRVNRDLKTAAVIGWRNPAILFPARAVPLSLRGSDPFWDGVEADPIASDFNAVRTQISHELEHVRRRDHLKLWLVALTGCVVPWEWVVGKTDLEKSAVTRNRVFRWLSRLLKVIGKPYRWGLEAERRRQEEQADASAATQEGGREALNRLREGRGLVLAPPTASTLLEDWREAVFALVFCVLIAGAPGSSIVRMAVEGKMDTLLAMPATWSLELEPGFGKGTAGRLPGGGKVVVDIEEVVPGHWPKLHGTGRFHTADLPDQGWVEMSWVLVSEENVPKSLAAHLLFARVPMVEDTKQEALTVRADPSEAPEDLGGHRYRFHRKIDLSTLQPKPTWIYLEYFFQAPGRWIFDPPMLEIVAPNGTRRPFQSA